MPAIVLHFVRRLRQFRLFGLRQSRQSEIQNLGVAILRQEQVLRLQIAMNDSLFMGRRKSLRNLYPVIDDFPNWQRTALQSLAQRFAFQQFRNQVRRTLVAFPSGTRPEYSDDSKRLPRAPPARNDATGRHQLSKTPAKP